MTHAQTRRIRPSVAVVAAISFGTALIANQMGHDGMRYDVRTEVTLRGTIDDVMQVPGTGPMSGTHLSLKTTTETIHVHLGPTAFVAKQGVPFANGDAVTVIGSRIKGEGFEAILARLVRKGEDVATFREPDGTPRWAMGG